MEASALSKAVTGERADVTLSENLTYLKPSETVSINQETQRRKASLVSSFSFPGLLAE